MGIVEAAEDGARAELAVIDVTERPLRAISADALDALVEANDPPVLFVRFGSIARVRGDERERPIIDRVGESILRHRLERSAQFVRVTAKGKKGRVITPCAPPTEVVQDILALGAWPFP